MSECSTAISNAESFLQRLQGDLGVLEEAQILTKENKVRTEIKGSMTKEDGVQEG